MLNLILDHVLNHWMLSTYLSVMILNEGAILSVFSLVSHPDFPRMSGLVAASIAGALTNDIILYFIACRGVGRYLTAHSEKWEPESLFERVFLGNVFRTLLFIKFLFGLRLFLTMYLVAKKKIPFGQFVAYDLCGIILYVVVIGSLGFLVGQGVAHAETLYQNTVRLITILSAFILATHVIGIFLKKKILQKDAMEKKLPLSEQ